MFLRITKLCFCAGLSFALMGCGGSQPTIDEDPSEPLALDPVTAIVLIYPAFSPSLEDSPRFRVEGVASGDRVELHTNSECTNIASARQASGATVNIEVSQLDPGLYRFYAKRVHSASGSQSPCSAVSAVYELANDSLVITGLSNLVTPVKSHSWTWGCSGAINSCEFRYVINSDSGFLFGSEPYALTNTAAVALGDGIFYLHVQARDSLVTSLVSEQVTVQVILDNTAPPAPSLVALASGINSIDRVLTPSLVVSGVSSTDNVRLHSDSSCTGLLGSTLSSGPQATVVSAPLADGTYFFYASVEDQAGNVSACSAASATYLLDTQSPFVAITSASDISAANQAHYTVIGSCEESGVPVNLSIGTISLVLNCSDGSFYSGAVDVSGLSDSGSLIVLASQTDAAGNLGQDFQSITKDTFSDFISIGSAPPVSKANQFGYSLSGSCSRDGSLVAVEIGSLSFDANCNLGVWSLSQLNVASLPDSPSLVIRANHLTAPEASVTISKDSLSPTVGIQSAPDISSLNVSAYAVSGTCSENGQSVSVSIAGIAVTTNCVSGAWSTGPQDVSGLSDGPSLLITADHQNASGDPAQQVSRSVVKATGTPVVYELSVPTTLATTAHLNWSLFNPGAFVVSDYEIRYRPVGSTVWLAFDDGVSTILSATATDLLPSTAYEFQVRVVYDGTRSSYSQSAVGVTKPDSQLFKSPYKAMNVGGATSTNVVAFYDDTYVVHNGVTIPQSPLARGQVVNLVTSPFDVIDASQPIFAAGRRGSGGNTSKANVVWSPTTWAGKSFSFNAIRNNEQQLSVYATEDAAVEVRQGSNVLAAVTLSANEHANLNWSVYGSYQVISTGTILAYHLSIGGGSLAVDPKPLLPSHTEILGFPSASMRLTADSNGTNYTYIHSNSATDASVINAASVANLTPQGTSSQYSSESLLIRADQPVSGASFADSDGNCAAPFLPTNQMKTKYAINAEAEWVAFASKLAGSIYVYSPSQVVGVETPVATLTLTRSGANPQAPYRVRLTGAQAGYRFVSDVPVAAWYEPNTDTGAALEDETVLYGFD